MFLLQLAGQVCLKLVRPLASSLAQQAPAILSASSGSTVISASLPRSHPQHSRWLSAIHTSSALCRSQQHDEEHERQKTINEQTQEVSKSFITSVLNMEEAWLNGVAGQLKMWAAAKKVPELKVCLPHQYYFHASCFLSCSCLWRPAMLPMIIHAAFSNISSCSGHQLLVGVDL